MLMNVSLLMHVDVVTALTVVKSDVSCNPKRVIVLSSKYPPDLLMGGDSCEDSYASRPILPYRPRTPRAQKRGMGMFGASILRNRY